MEARVVGSLVEKQLTTPQQYPLTLNSLTLACNQSSNRDPVVSFSESRVQAALDSLKQRGLVRFVLPSHGRSVVRYRHVLDEKLALDARQLSLVAVLLLRGAQTVGELRSRTERMARFESTAEVESDLDGLARWDDPLVARLPRQPGQKEERWTQLLTPAAGDGSALGRTEGSALEQSERGGGSPAGNSAVAPARAGSDDRTASADGAGRELAELKETLAALRAEVEMLREEVLSLRIELADATGGD